MQNGFDVVVLGLGGMGTATVFELARRGRRVLGLEQFAVGHDRAASRGSTRIIRKAYWEHPDYVPILHCAYERWFELEQRSGKHLLTECGCLNVGPPAGERVSGVLRAAREYRLSLEQLDAGELRRRYPMFQFDEHVSGVFEPGAGYLYVDDCVRAYAAEARALGAELHENEPIHSWLPSATGVTVTTARGTYAADRLVITAGPWTGGMLADLGLPLTVLRKVIFWFGTEDNSRFRRDRFPIYLAETPAGFYFGFPVLDRDGAKIGRHDGGEAVEPSQVERRVAPGEDADCWAFLRQRLPQMSGPLRRSLVCLYTVTPEHHFILDRHLNYSQVAIAAGFSGHGSKFASVVGEVMADLAERGATRLPIARFRLDRFHG
jgi:sarcosine oxidase